MGIGELHYRSLSSVFFVLLLFRDWGGGRGIRGVSFFCVFYPYDLPSGPSDPTFTREGRSPELLFAAKCAQQLSYGFNILNKLEGCPQEI